MFALIMPVNSLEKASYLPATYSCNCGF